MVAQVKATADFDLGRDVFRQIKTRPELSREELNVKVEGSVITLEGTVATGDEKRAAERAALDVYGVSAVANDIVVKPPSERTDTEIAREIIGKFRSNILVPADDVKVIVTRGLVRLVGAVPSQFGKMLAEASAKSVRGIRGISNEIEVKPEAFSAKAKNGSEAEEMTALTGWAEPGW
jgi:osmotically-inducible protein OsmY